jgi:hypothetical protein
MANIFIELRSHLRHKIEGQLQMTKIHGSSPSDSVEDEVEAGVVV